MTTPTDPTDPTAPRPEEETFEECIRRLAREDGSAETIAFAEKFLAAVPSSPPSGGATGEREASADDLMTLRSLHIENPPDKPWSAKAGFDGPAAEMFAAALCDFYRKSGGENYVEMHMRDPASPSEEFVVTVQRKAGKTPHELRREAEAALAALPREATGVSEAMVENVARRYVPENNGGVGCGDAPNLLSLADRMALVRAGAALDAGRTP